MASSLIKGYKSQSNVFCKYTLSKAMIYSPLEFKEAKEVLFLLLFKYREEEKKVARLKMPDTFLL